MPTTRELQEYIDYRFPGYRIETKPYASEQGVIQLFDAQSRLISELIAEYDDESDDFPETSCELIAAQVAGQKLWLKDPELAKKLFQEAGAVFESDESK
jgi:hypothetical protein